MRLLAIGDADNIVPHHTGGAMRIFGIVFATLGAGMILFALTYVTLVVGGLVNAMVVLMAGPLVDRLLARKR